MTDLLDSIRNSLKPREADNRLVPLVVSGQAPRSVFARVAAEESHIVPSDWRAFLTLAARSPEPNARQFFAMLAGGEGLAVGKLPALAAAGGFDSAALAAYEPEAGCQAYPAFVAWLAANAEPADVVIAMSSNFAAWGSYCAAIASAMRSKYDLDGEATAFFDFFAAPATELEALAAAAIAASSPTSDATRYAKLFQSYELMFWNTLADAAL
jgi:hypothetical protein